MKEVSSSMVPKVTRAALGEDFDHMALPAILDSCFGYFVILSKTFNDEYRVKFMF